MRAGKCLLRKPSHLRLGKIIKPKHDQGADHTDATRDKVKETHLPLEQADGDRVAAVCQIKSDG
jgi:hypothetical protein